MASGAAAQSRAEAASGDTLLTPQVQAPYYGDALFGFFVERSFEAVTGLMVSQHFQRMQPHDDEAELLRGGLLLSWGLHQEAAKVFEQLAATRLPQSVRDRAWFHLAKIRYQRGAADAASEALARIDKPLSPTLEEERTLLHARLLMGRGEHAAAAELLAKLPPEASAVAQFNLGIALIKAGDVPKGMALLDALGQRAAKDEEQRALRDRANVALGYAALQNQLGADARRVLQRVRLQGPDAGKALLGYGWAAIELGEPRNALVPWNELLARPVSEAATVEAYIAAPFALAQSGSEGLALAGYERAVSAFAAEGEALQQSMTAIREGRLVAALLRQNPRQGLGWLGGAEQLPGWDEMPHAGHLAPVLAAHEFQEGFKNLHDLRFVDGNLRGWQDKLGAFTDMLENRRQAFAERLPRARAMAGTLDIPSLEKRRAALAAEVAAAESAADGEAFADARERALRERLAAAEATLARGSGGDPDTAAARERVRRISGALTWQLAQQQPQRLWNAQKALRGTEEAIAAANERDRALARAQAGEPQRFERYAERIAALRERIAGLLPQVAALAGEQAAQLQEITITALTQQQERLEVYTTQARLGIAQIHDRAQLAFGRPDGARPEATRAQPPSSGATRPDATGADPAAPGPAVAPRPATEPPR